MELGVAPALPPTTSYPYTQCLGQLMVLFPATAGDTLQVVQSFSTFRVPPNIIRCTLPAASVYHVFWFTMAAPCLGVVFVLLFLLLKWSVMCRSSLELAILHPSQRRRILERSFMRGKSTWQVVMSCVMVAFYFLYPTLIAQIAELNHCVRYDFGVPTCRLCISPAQPSPHSAPPAPAAAAASTAAADTAAPLQTHPPVTYTTKEVA